MTDKQAEAMNLRSSLLAHLDGLSSWNIKNISLHASSQASSKELEPEALANPYSDFDLDSLASTAQQCQECSLCSNRNQSLMGVGDPQAKLMFISESPSEEEDQAGALFADEAGELLTKMIGAMGWKREQIYFTNMLKCSPKAADEAQDALLPEYSHFATCFPFLMREIQIIKPQCILALGERVGQLLLQSDSSLQELRSAFHPFPACAYNLDGVDSQLIVSFSPYELLQNPAAKSPAWQDLQMVMREFPAIK